MMDVIYDWIVSITAAGLVGSIALALTPQGPVKKVTRMTVGLLIIIVILKPLGSVSVEDLSFATMQYRALYDEYTEVLGSTNQTMMKSIIEDRTVAYISQKGDELGMTIDAEVEARAKEVEIYGEDSRTERYFIPYSVKLKPSVTPSEKSKSDLSHYIEVELGIPKDRQTWLLQDKPADLPPERQGSK